MKNEILINNTQSSPVRNERKINAGEFQDSQREKKENKIISFNAITQPVENFHVDKKIQQQT
jgi:hypothetical protein